MKYDMTI